MVRKNANLTNLPFDKSSKTLLVDHALFALDVKYVIESKRFVLTEYNLRITGGNIGTHTTHVNSLGGALRTNPVG